MKKVEIENGTDLALFLTAISGVVVFVGVFIVALSVFNGWILSNLWNWLIAPTFSVRELSIPQAVAVMITLRFASIDSAKESSQEGKFWARLTANIFVSFVVLGFAYLLRSYI